jgi:hypothetical protein
VYADVETTGVEVCVAVGDVDVTSLVDESVAGDVSGTELDPEVEDVEISVEDEDVRLALLLPCVVEADTEHGVVGLAEAHAQRELAALRTAKGSVQLASTQGIALPWITA